MSYVVCKVCNATVSGDFSTNEELLAAHNALRHPTPGQVRTARALTFRNDLMNRRRSGEKELPEAIAKPLEKVVTEVFGSKKQKVKNPAKK
jgi:hypothetical protein